jgi:hypothetical protein
MTIFDGRPDRAFLWNLVSLYNSACQALDRLEANACSSISWSIGYSSYETTHVGWVLSHAHRNNHLC